MKTLIIKFQNAASKLTKIDLILWSQMFLTVVVYQLINF